MRVDRSSASHALAFACLFSACGSEDQGDLNWQVSFACIDQAERSEQVQLGIVAGECPATGVPIYQQFVKRDGDGKVSAPGELPVGDYAFFARAFDVEGQKVAEGCTTVSLPTSEVIELELMGGASAACRRAARNDAGSPDADPACALDSDGDGTSDCDDGCPSDPSRIDAGSCGCGSTEPFDTPGFADSMGFGCGDWKGYDCSKAHEDWQYTEAEEATILAQCSKTCGVCPPEHY